MARKQSGGVFSKILNVIGLVDEPDPRERQSYDDGYGGQDYGRNSTYIPPRSSAAQKAAPRNVNARNSQYSQQRQQPNAPRKRTALFERDDDPRADYYGSEQYDYSPRQNPATARNPSSDAGYATRQSRFSDDYDQPARRQQPDALSARPKRAPSNPRPSMLSLHSLEDCCDVINHLIAGNLVVLTMDSLDVKLLQRAVDTLSGAVFALHATIRKASDRTYLIAPHNVEVNEAYDVERRF